MHTAPCKGPTPAAPAPTLTAGLHTPQVAARAPAEDARGQPTPAAAYAAAAYSCTPAARRRLLAARPLPAAAYA